MIGSEYGAGTMSTLAGTSPEALYDEVQADPTRFNLSTYVAGAARWRSTCSATWRMCVFLTGAIGVLLLRRKAVSAPVLASKSFR